jgi:type II secretory pathway component PulF
VTLQQAPTPPQPSQPQIEVEQQSPGVLKVVFTVVQKFPAWGAVLVALAAIAAYVVLKLRGAL